MARLLATLLCALAAARAEPQDCGLPKERGACGQFAVRYYYDTDYGGCLRFWYGGCGGNGNRFATESECERACVSPPGDELCRLPAVRGACKRAKQRWYSDPSGRCRTFTYSGCLGNDNRFETEEACQQRCGGGGGGGGVSPDGGSGGSGGGDGGVPVTPPGPAACLLPDRVAGECSQYQIRYSFVAARQQCAPFYYGGCGGNDNRFDTAEACQAACVKPPSPRPPYYGPRDRTSYGREDQPSYGREDQPSYGREDQPSYGREDQPSYGREDQPSYGREDQPSYGREDQPSYGREDQPSYGREDQPSYGREDRPSYGREDQPSYGREGQPNYGREGQPSYGREDQPSYGREDQPSYGREDQPSYGREDQPSYGREDQPSYGREDQPSYGREDQPSYGREDQPSYGREDQPSYGREDQPSYGREDQPSYGREDQPSYGREDQPSYGREDQPSYGREDQPSYGREDQPSYGREDQPSYGREDQPSYGREDQSSYGREDQSSYGREDQPSYGREDQPGYGKEDGRVPPTETPYAPSPTDTESPDASISRQGPEDPCSLPKEVGPCRASMPRFYFSAASGSCVDFIFGGCRGNANNFRTREECEARCGGAGRFPPQEEPTEAPETEAPDAYIPLPGVVEPAVDPCALPKDTGPCRAFIPSFYYEASLQRCLQFGYGGCDGNANRFETIEDCEQRCAPITDPCALPKDTGPCRAYIPSFFYDTEQQRCSQFIYGGCDGNANRFGTRDECEQRCGAAATTAPATEEPERRPEPPATTELDACSQPPVGGNCGERLQRYYFNVPLRRCFTFVYSGCGGNENRFESEAECAAQCLPGEPVTASPDSAPTSDAPPATSPATTVDYSDYPTFYNGLGFSDGDGYGTPPPDYYEDYYPEYYK